MLTSGEQADFVGGTLGSSKSASLATAVIMGDQWRQMAGGAPNNQQGALVKVPAEY